MANRNCTVEGCNALEFRDTEICQRHRNQDTRAVKKKKEEEYDWNCSKCDHDTFVKDEIATTGTGLTKFLDIQNRRFIVIACENCSFCEIYRGTSSSAGAMFDFLIG
jgi:hypothetical protein